MRTYLITVLAMLGVLGLLTGCGSGGDTAGTDVGPATGASIEVAGTINYGSFGTKSDIDCAEGKSLNIGGSNNVLKVRGTCRTVSVGGADNTITLERVDGELNVVGLNNNVSYAAGDPAVTDAGAGNRITKR